MKEQQGKFTEKPAPVRDVVDGDQVYYQHPEHGHQVGEVSGTPGKDGFQVRHRREGGGLDGIPWANLIGFKQRKQRTFKLIDRGEDGALCEDEDGKTVFLRNGSDQPRAAEPERLSKALVDAEAEHRGDLRTLALELGRAQLETASMLVAAMDRMTAATMSQTAAIAAQTARIDQLIAMQVAQLNFAGEHHGHAGPFHQEHQAAPGLDGA